MSDKKDDGSDEPEVIIVPPEDQDIIPPDSKQADDSAFVDDDATPFENSEPVRKASRLGTWIVLLVVVAFVGGFVAWPKLAPTLEPWLPESLKPGTSRLIEVTKALDELAVRIATLKTSAVDQNVIVDLEDRIKAELADLRKRVSDVAARPVLPDSLADDVLALAGRLEDLSAQLQQEVATLKEQIESVGTTASNQNSDSGQAQNIALPDEIRTSLQTFSAALQDLTNRVTGLEGNSEVASTVVPAEHAHDNLTSEVSALKTLTTDLVARLSSAEARLAAVADASVGGAGAALVAAAGQLRSRIESGLAFDADLGTVQTLAGTDEGLKATLADIQLGMGGIASVSTLARDFSAVASDVLAAAKAPASNWMEKVWRRLSSMVSVRRTGDVSGDDVAARIARTEMHLNTGDLAAAVNEVKDLTGAAAEAVGPWLQQAQLRLKTMTALDDLTRQAVQRLAQPSGATK
jgi:hypothetical protein